MKIPMPEFGENVVVDWTPAEYLEFQLLKQNKEQSTQKNIAITPFIKTITNAVVRESPSVSKQNKIIINDDFIDFDDVQNLKGKVNGNYNLYARVLQSKKTLEFSYSVVLLSDERTPNLGRSVSFNKDGKLNSLVQSLFKSDRNLFKEKSNREDRDKIVYIHQKPFKEGYVSFHKAPCGKISISNIDWNDGKLPIKSNEVNLDQGSPFKIRLTDEEIGADVELKNNIINLNQAKKDDRVKHERKILGRTGELAFGKWLQYNNIDFIWTNKEQESGKIEDFIAKIDGSNIKINVKTSDIGNCIIDDKHYRDRSLCDIYCAVKRNTNNDFYIRGFISKDEIYNLIKNGKAEKKYSPNPYYIIYADLLKENISTAIERKSL